MNTGITYLIATTAIIFIFAISRSEKAVISENWAIYNYPSIVKKLTLLPLIVLPGLMIIVAINNNTSLDSIVSDEVDELIKSYFVCLIFMVISLYIHTFSIIITSREIIKKSIFGKVKLPYSSVSSIVVSNGRGNRSAAVIKVYGNKTIRVDSFLTEYDQLKDEIIYRCEDAKLIET